MTRKNIIEKMYADFEAGNIPAVIARLDDDIVWERPGSPFIPFSGTFSGIEAVKKMIAIQAATIAIQIFLPEHILSDEDTTVVLGKDTATVLETGKAYSTIWAHSFVFKNDKIIQARVFMDTKTIADAFEA